MYWHLSCYTNGITTQSAHSTNVHAHILIFPFDIFRCVTFFAPKEIKDNVSSHNVNNKWEKVGLPHTYTLTHTFNTSSQFNEVAWYRGDDDDSLLLFLQKRKTTYLHLRWAPSLSKENSLRLCVCVLGCCIWLSPDVSQQIFTYQNWHCHYAVQINGDLFRILYPLALRNRVKENEMEWQ